MIACAVLWFVYAPEHWLHAINSAAVRVDGRPVRAEVYIGQPTDNEAQAIALVHVPDVGDYFLDFEEEEYREASSRDFVRMKRGAWTLKSMRDGHFLVPLPFQKLNEFRFSSRGRIVAVQF